MSRTALGLAAAMLVSSPALAFDLNAVKADESGIASKYVKDAGIAKDPAVIFAEDFEDEELRARGWYDLRGWKKELVITDEDKATGAKSLKIVYPKGGTGPWFRAPHFKHGIEKIHVRYYRKWADGWNWGGPGDGNGHDTRLVANGPELPRQAYKANDMTVLMMESCTHFNPWKRGVFGLMLYTRGQYITDAIREQRKKEKAQGHKLGGGEWWLATVDKTRSPKSPPGRWFCVEYMGKMNTPGKADGEIKSWIDGKLVYHIKNTMIRDGTAKNATWRRWWVGPYFHGGTTKDQHSYIDSLVVATKYIGPISKGVLFKDGFESGDMSATNPDGFKWANNNRTSVVTAKKAVWNNGKRDNAISEGSDWKAKTGKHSLRFSYPPGEPWAEQRFNMGKPYKDLWVRYWLRVPKNYVHTRPSRNGKFFCIWMDGYSAKGKGPTAWWTIWPGGNGNTNAAICYSKGGNTTSRGQRQHKLFITVPADRGRWMQVVFHVKAATNRDSKDGVMQMWRRWENEPTFTKLSEDLKSDIAPPPGGPDGWQRGYIMGWMNGGFKERTEFLIDDFTLSTKSLLDVSSDEGAGAGAGTPEPEKAAAVIAPAMTGVERQRASSERAAGRLLQMARQAERMGQRSVARSLYAQIVEKHPGTEIALKAKARLK